MVVPLARWHARSTASVGRASRARRATRSTPSSTIAVLPHDPTARTRSATGLAKSLEAAPERAATVGNNLAAALDKARGDSLYARLAFLFLGLPGRAARSAPDRSRSRPPELTGAGASRRCCARAARRVAALVRIALSETMLVGVVGGVSGLAAALVIGRSAFGSATLRRRADAARSVGGRVARRRPRGRRRCRSRCPRGATRGALTVQRRAQRRSAARARPGGPARPRSARAGGAVAVFGRPGATATSSCSRRRASPRSRSTTGRSSRRCSPGSASDC